MGTPLFVIILLIYILIEYTINHLRGEDEDSNPLFIITMPVFVIPAAMIAMPVFSYRFLSPFHIIILIPAPQVATINIIIAGAKVFDRR